LTAVGTCTRWTEVPPPPPACRLRTGYAYLHQDTLANFLGADQWSDLASGDTHRLLHWLVRCLGRGVLLEGRSVRPSRDSGHIRSASPACGAPSLYRSTPTSPCSKADWCRVSHTRDSIDRNWHRRGQRPSADAWWCHRWWLLGAFLRHSTISCRCNFGMRSRAGPSRSSVCAYLRFVPRGSGVAPPAPQGRGDRLRL